MKKLLLEIGVSADDLKDALRAHKEKWAPAIAPAEECAEKQAPTISPVEECAEEVSQSICGLHFMGTV